nr:MAG TPA: hypothetical protein [Caudoviricetes sp.]
MSNERVQRFILSSKDCLRCLYLRITISLYTRTTQNRHRVCSSLYTT